MATIALNRSVQKYNRAVLQADMHIYKHKFIQTESRLLLNVRYGFLSFFTERMAVNGETAEMYREYLRTLPKK